MIFFDIETLDFFHDPAIAALPREQQIGALRFGVAVTYNDHMDMWLTWSLDELPMLWSYLVNENICGWNIRAFDLPVIHANLARFHDYPNADLDPIGRVVDIVDDIRQATGRWYKLDTVAQANLGRGKIAHGQQATEWLRSGDPALMRKAAEYCRDDVALVVALYEKLRRGEALVLPPRLERGETEVLDYRVQ